ncbi:MAG: glycerol-3-phosphate acyltransferase, partial [Selenomonadaceae bacterium]|nr:glycerol-3-phosphate acyltransferase [Selenomonadaceae bacterium]
MTAGILIFSYLLGSIPNGLIFGKLIWHKDLRNFGSHNIGATNAWRVIGAKAGILIFLLDFLKGAVSVALAKIFVGDAWVMVLAGLLAILGHTFSIFLKLRGGQGVATGLGVIALMMPKVTAIV